MKILDAWLKDVPQQYLGKKNIEVLISAFARQLQEVNDVFEQINLLTDIDTATGKNLDYLGDIIGLSRREAGILAKDSDRLTMEDERYRQYLRYQIFVNTNECTYYDIMKPVEMFWKGPQLTYSEPLDRPATIAFDFDADEPFDESSYSMPLVKPGGVGLQFNMHKQEEFGAYFGLGMTNSVVVEIGCEIPVLDPQTYLTTNDGIILTDEKGNWLSV